MGRNDDTVCACNIFYSSYHQSEASAEKLAVSFSNSVDEWQLIEAFESPFLKLILLDCRTY